MQKEEYIKIYKSKEQWVQEFLCKTEPIKENEDFLHANYCMHEDKTKKEIYKGMFDEKYEQVQITGKKLLKLQESGSLFRFSL